MLTENSRRHIAPGISFDFNLSYKGFGVIR